MAQRNVLGIDKLQTCIIMDTGKSSQWGSWASQKSHIQNIENYVLEALDKILKHLITCTKHFKDLPEFFN